MSILEKYFYNYNQFIAYYLNTSLHKGIECNYSLIYAYLYTKSQCKQKHKKNKCNNIRKTDNQTISQGKEWSDTYIYTYFSSTWAEMLYGIFLTNNTYGK